MASSFPTVTLTRAQADALCAWLWEDLREGCVPDVDLFLVTRALVHISDAVEWQRTERRETYDVAIDSAIDCLMSGEYFRSFLADSKRNLAAFTGEVVDIDVSLPLDRETRRWVHGSYQSVIVDHELFISAASGLIGEKQAAELVAA